MTAKGGERIRMKKGKDTDLNTRIGGNQAGGTAAVRDTQGDDSLAKYMTRLLQMPVGEEQRKQLESEGFPQSEVSQGMALAYAVLAKAIDKGDIAVFKAVKELEDKELGGSCVLEEMIRGISSALRQEDGLSLSKNGQGTDQGEGSVLLGGDGGSGRGDDLFLSGGGGGLGQEPE